MGITSGSYLTLTAGTLTNLSGNNNNAYTIGMWINTTQTGAALLAKGNGGWIANDENFFLTSGVGAGGGGNGTHMGGVQWGGGWVGGNTSVNTGTWTFVSLVRQGGTSTVYVNGNPDGTSTAMGNAEQGTQTIYLGFNMTDGGDGVVNYSGSESGTYVFGTALTQAEIQTLMHAGPGAIAFQGSAMLPSTTPVSIAAGAALDVAGAVQTIASLSGVPGSHVYLGNGALTIGGGSSTVFAGNISDAGGASNGVGGSLTLDGPGTLELSGTDTYTGGTIDQEGTLVLASPAALLGGSSLTVGNNVAALGGLISSPASSSAAAPVAGPAVAAVPEPGTLALLAAGLALGFGLWRRRV
jgi:autotransporter-associated beta strand protein